MDAAPLRGGVVSLLFWLCLLAATGLYAAVALAPKAWAYLTLRETHYGNQVRLVTLERQVHYLGKVVDALEHDPEFAGQVARIDFDAVRPGDEPIAVDASLTLEARAPEPLAGSPAGRLPWYAPLIRPFAHNTRYRGATLLAAALLTLLAFTFLHESQAGHLAPIAGGAHNVLRSVADRYRRSGVSRKRTDVS